MQAKGILGVWTGAKPGTDAAFNEWYNREHMNERCDVPGFINARRYRAVSGTPRYLALYDLADLGVLASPAYRQALDNPSPWTQQCMAYFDGIIRSEFVIRHQAGRGYGGVVASIRATVRGLPDARLGDWLAASALPAIVEQPGIVGARYLETTSTGAAQVNTESKLRAQPDQVADWAIIVEGDDVAAVRAACRAELSRDALRSHGAGRHFSIGCYRLLCTAAPLVITKGN
jgi:hypothetical protein